MVEKARKKQLSILFSAEEYSIIKKAAISISLKPTTFIRMKVIEESKKILKANNE